MTNDKPEAKQDVILSDEEIETLSRWFYTKYSSKGLSPSEVMELHRSEYWETILKAQVAHLDHLGLIRKPSPVEGELKKFIEDEANYYAHEFVVPITGTPSNASEEAWIAKYKAEFVLFGDKIISKATPLIEERVRKETMEWVEKTFAPAIPKIQMTATGTWQYYYETGTYLANTEKETTHD